VKHVIPSGIRALAFDAVGTLIHPEPPAAVVYTEAGRRFGSSLTLAAVTERFAIGFRRQEEIDRIAGFRTDQPRELARWRAVVAEVLDDVADPERCFNYLYEHFARPSSWRTTKDSESTIASLATRGYRIGIASNFDERLAAVLAPGELSRWPLVISAAVGWRKPAVAFFTSVCRALRAESRAVLYVGNEAETDYFGARAAGLSTVLFDPDGRAPDTVARVASLGELLANERESVTN
jgi:putative hydrolase of the HAD superfamily